jgi:hypothetical protein
MAAMAGRNGEMPRETVTQKYGWVPLRADEVRTDRQEFSVSWTKSERQGEVRPAPEMEAVIIVEMRKVFTDPDATRIVDVDAQTLGLNRAEVNRMIKALRRARDQVFGKDE